MIDFTLLDPIFRPKVIQFQQKCDEAGLRVHITQGARSLALQQTLYDSGLSHAVPSNDPHTVCDSYGAEASLAIDFACFDEKMAYITDGTHPDYRKAGEIAESLGLHWGGRWKHPDPDHVEDSRWIWHSNDQTVHPLANPTS